eukprot:m.219780 g.219780  ORF g.219780 m.219780 type:complete len:340 (+) comp17005_c0_seq1:172-1191(+)
MKAFVCSLLLLLIAHAAAARVYTEADVKKAYNDGYADGMQAVLRNYGEQLDIQHTTVDYEVAGLDTQDSSACDCSTSPQTADQQHTVPGWEGFLKEMEPLGLTQESLPEAKLFDYYLRLGHFKFLWPVTIYDRLLPETHMKLLPAIQDVILQHRNGQTTQSSAKHTTVGGWHSDEMMDWPEHTVRDLERMILEHAKVVIDNDDPHNRSDRRSNVLLSLWANVLDKGGFNRPHQHAGLHGAHWSGVLYVDIGNPSDPTSGSFELFTRQTNPVLGWKATRHTVSPQTGQILIFPADMFHYVAPYDGDTTRISVSFNIKLLSESRKLSPGIYCSNCMYELLV